MKIALDTNRYTDFVRGEDSIARVVETAEQVILPFIVVAELRSGFAVGSKLKANEERLQEFLNDSAVACMYPDRTTIQHYVDMYAELRRKGKKIPTNDLWIAAVCMQHQLTLCSRDSHFDHLPQLPRA